MEKQHAIMGLWKFRDSVPLKALCELAGEWLSSDDNYTSMVVRKCGPSEWGIAFTYTIPADVSAQNGQDRYKSKISAELRATFGEAFCGWDIGAPAYVVL